MDSRVYWTAAFISIIYALDYEGAKFFVGIIPLYKHLVDFLFILLVFTAGSLGSSFLPDNWQKTLWNYVYVTTIIILVLYGIFDHFDRVESGNIREMFSNFRMFFTTPVPFGILIFFSKVAPKNTSGILQRHS